MGVKKKPTLKILFRQFAISLIVMLVAAIIVPSGLEGLAVNAGLATRANLSELQVKEIIPTLTIAPDITKVVIPQGCGYLILDKNFNELYSNMDDDEKEIALLYAKGADFPAVLQKAAALRQDYQVTVLAQAKKLGKQLAQLETSGFAGAAFADKDELKLFAERQ